MSAGFHRMGANVKKKGLRWDNRLFDPSQGGQPLLSAPIIGDGTGLALPPAPVVETPSIGFRAVLKEPPETFEPGPPKITRENATQFGYTGNQCVTCNGVRMKINGHCEVCEDCGNSTGCS